MPDLEQLHRLLIARGNLVVEPVLAHPQQEVRHATADSRQVRAGGLFVAHVGRTVDGHDFIPAALAAGAATVLGAESVDRFAERCRRAGQPPVPYLQVHSSAQALAQAAALVAGFPARALRMAGITGTDGKTTSTALLASMLRATPEAGSQSGSAAPATARVGLISTLGISLGGPVAETGYHVTTPDAGEVQQALRNMVTAGCQYAVLECTSHGLDQERVAETEMDVVGVTNVAHEHLDYHGSFDAYLQAKCRILDLLSDGPGRVALANAEDACSLQALGRRAMALNAARPRAMAVRSYGLGSEPGWTFQGSDLQQCRSGISLTLHGPGLHAVPLRAALWGRFNAQNALLAAAMAHTLGATPHQMAAGLASFRGLTGRMERLELGQPYTAIVDFAHSPQALQHALQTIRQHMRLVPGTGRLIAVFGSAGLRDPGKRQLLGAVSARLADHVVITAEDPRSESLETICAAIEEGFNAVPTTATCEIEPDRARALEKATALARAGDVVAAFGKGHERSMCFGETEYPWSDQQALRLAIQRQLGHSTDRKAVVYQLPTR